MTFLINTFKKHINFFQGSKSFPAKIVGSNNIYPLPLFFSIYKKDYYLPLPKKPLLLLPYFYKKDYYLSLPKKILSLPYFYKKDYYLPLPKKNILTNISGLASLSDILRTDLESKKNYFKIFAKFILIETSKILYYLFNKPYSEETFTKSIFESFSLIYTKPILNLNSELNHLNKTRHLNTCQHLLNIICNKFSIDVNTLNKIINKTIDFTHYKNIPISLLIEYFIFNENIKNLTFNDPTFHIKFIDHENHMLGEKPEIYKREESLQQISQRHSDMLLYKLFWNSKGIIQINKFYRDIKADYKGTAKGHFTLIPHLYSDQKTAQAYMNNYTTFLEKKIKENMRNKIILEDHLIRLKDIRDKCSNKNLNLKSLVLNFNQMLLNMSLNVSLGINFTIASDITIDNSFRSDILPIIERNVENNEVIFEVDVLFPKDNKINVEEFNNLLLEIINKILPEELRKDLHHNFNKFIEYDTK